MGNSAFETLLKLQAPRIGSKLVFHELQFPTFSPNELLSLLLFKLPPSRLLQKMQKVDLQPNASGAIAPSSSTSTDSSAKAQLDEKDITTTITPVQITLTRPDSKSETDKDSYEDDWDNDPENARNWSFRKKWTAVSVVALYCFITPLSSSMMAPGLPQVALQYHITNSTILALTLSIFLISFALGPLILSPLSELYGRTWVLHISNIFTLAFNLACAFAPNTATLLVLRFLAGFCGSAPVAVGGGTIGDLFSEKDRASAMAIFTLGPLLGPAIGPGAAGFIVQAAGIRWVFIFIAIISAIACVVGIPFLRETYGPVIRLRRARKAGDLEGAARAHPDLVGASNKSVWRMLWINLSRPAHLLFGSFICFILSLYQAFNYGIYYLMFATFAKLFKDTYGFQPGVGGLAYLGLGIGFLFASFLGAKFSDTVYHKLSEKNGGKGTPEMRMPALFLGSLIVPIGLLWYGWSAHAKVHWIMPIIGSAIYGFGLMTAYLPIQLYLVDAFTHAASATGASSVFRSLLGFVFPLFGQQMTDKLGLGPANTLLAGIAIVIGIPFPIWIYFKGAQIRARSNLAR